MVKYVIGHKNPDTDSVISAILYSDFLNNKNIEAKAFMLGEANNETRFILEKFGFDMPVVVSTLENESEVVLVDHNEKKQTIDNIDELIIDTIIDHHKFGIITSGPVDIRAEKLGSTASVLAKIFEEQNYTLSKEQAGILISAVISDTLFFRSPTTTDFDKELVNKLNAIAQIEDLEEYSLEMFNAKSDLGDISTEDMIKLDYKEFELGGEKYGIGVFETTNTDFAMDRKLEIIETLQEIKEKDELKGILFSVIDILNEKNTTIISDEYEAEVLRAVFSGKEIESNIFELGSIISRKKQIVPALEKYFG